MNSPHLSALANAIDLISNPKMRALLSSLVGMVDDDIRNAYSAKDHAAVNEDLRVTNGNLSAAISENVRLRQEVSDLKLKLNPPKTISVIIKAEKLSYCEANKFNTIKEWRGISGMGLADAKCFVEDLIQGTSKILTLDPALLAKSELFMEKPGAIV